MTPDAQPIGDLIVRVMLDIIARQTDPREQRAMLDIMRKDGWIPAEVA